MLQEAQIDWYENPWLNLAGAILGRAGRDVRLGGRRADLACKFLRSAWAGHLMESVGLEREVVLERLQVGESVSVLSDSI